MARTALATLALLLGIISMAGCHLCCNDCEVTKVCCPEIKTEPVEIEGWDVECEQICIPPVQCPCFGSCERKCGKVIAVRRLKADKIECGERCVVEYKLIDPCGPCSETPEAAPEPPPEPAPVEADAQATQDAETQ